MKTTFLKIIAGTGLAFTLIVVFAQFWAAAQNTTGKQSPTGNTAGNNAGKIVGVWDAQVMVRNCQTGAAMQSCRSLLNFAAGGTMQETTAGTAPNLRSPGHGVWRHLDENRFSNAFKFFHFKADGNYDGWQKTSQQIDLSADGKQFTATASIEIYDANDQLAKTGCATAAAVRFE